MNVRRATLTWRAGSSVTPAMPPSSRSSMCSWLRASNLSLMIYSRDFSCTPTSSVEGAHQSTIEKAHPRERQLAAMQIFYGDNSSVLFSPRCVCIFTYRISRSIQASCSGRVAAMVSAVCAAVPRPTVARPPCSGICWSPTVSGWGGLRQTNPN